MNILILKKFTYVYTINIVAKNATILNFESGFCNQIESSWTLWQVKIRQNKWKYANFCVVKNS